MSATDNELRLVQGGDELIPRVEPLWDALFDHHLSVGAAGIPTIERELSWPRRQAHYRRLFAGSPHVSIWLALEGDQPLAYALWHEDAIDGERVAVLESLSVAPQARGRGLGTRLMQVVDDQARSCGIELSAVDVLGGNERAQQLYQRYGFTPHSEFWMRSRQPSEASSAGSRKTLARDLGLELTIEPGPDDTWISSDHMAMLSWDRKAELERERLDQLLAGLEADDLWTIYVHIPVGPEATELRQQLQDQGFKLSMERLTRRCAPAASSGHGICRPRDGAH